MRDSDRTCLSLLHVVTVRTQVERHAMRTGPDTWEMLHARYHPMLQILNLRGSRSPPCAHADECEQNRAPGSLAPEPVLLVTMLFLLHASPPLYNGPNAYSSFKALLKYPFFWEACPKSLK